MAQTCKFEHPLSWVARLAAIPPGNASPRRRYNEWISTLLDAWDSHTWASEPCKELVSSNSAAVQSRLPMNVNGMDCVCCGNWLSSIFCHQNACKLAHGGVRCKLMIQYRLMAQWDPAHLADWFRWSFSKGDARSPESSDSPPFQCNAREPFRKREPPKLSWPRLTVDDVLLIQCWGGAFSQCFKF